MTANRPISGNESFVASLIEDALQTKGGYLGVGRGGYTLHCGVGRTLSGYDTDKMKQACIDAGLAVIDSRPIPFEIVVELAVNGPMIAVGTEPRFFLTRALSTEPLEVIAQRYREAGGDVHNIPESYDEPAA